MSLTFGMSEQRGGDRIGDLIFHDVRAAVPLGVDDHLGIREVRNRIELRIPHRVPAEHDGNSDEEEDQKPVLVAEIDNPVHHWYLAWAISSV